MKNNDSTNPRCVQVNASETAALLRTADNILILTHQYPDGDTLGSGYALCHALTALGKTVRVECSDSIPARYGYMFDGLTSRDFEPDFICAVDVADVQLLGNKLSKYADSIELCIDHHPSNTHYARKLFLEADYAAASMLVHEVIQELGVPVTDTIASCLYTGIATDSGCFQYTNTTAYTLRIAAELLEAGAQNGMINRVMFGTKTRQRVELERLALSGIKYHFDGRCAVMPLTRKIVEQSGAGSDDMEGLSPIPRQIEGVWVGVTMRELENGDFKVSLRSGHQVNVSAVCQTLGGGGHVRAAGCTLKGPVDAAVTQILEKLAPIMGKYSQLT